MLNTSSCSTDRLLKWQTLMFQWSHAHGCKVLWFCGVIAALIWWLMKGFYLYWCTSHWSEHLHVQNVSLYAVLNDHDIDVICFLKSQALGWLKSLVVWEETVFLNVSLKMDALLITEDKDWTWVLPKLFMMTIWMRRLWRILQTIRNLSLTWRPCST